MNVLHFRAVGIAGDIAYAHRLLGSKKTGKNGRNHLAPLARKRNRAPFRWRLANRPRAFNPNRKGPSIYPDSLRP
jgi:hypothetical protein